MKSHLTALFAAILLCAATTVTLAQEYRGERFDRGEHPDAEPMVGTWDAAVTITNCTTGSPIASCFSTANFNEGGTYSGITGGTNPTVRTSERGLWEHVRGHLYRFRFRAYLYNSAAVAIAYQIVTHDVALNKDGLHYTSWGTSEVFDMEGNPTSAGCSTAVGTRMTLD